MTRYIIDYHNEALIDSRDAYINYEIHLKGLGERFLMAIQQKMETIADAPLLYSTSSKKEYREAKVKDFPYLIVYQIYPKKKRILVSSIHHTKLHPIKKYRK